MAEQPIEFDIPDFDSFLKERADDKKEKKRAGIPWWPNFAAARGMGVASQIAVTLASKLGLLAIFGAISVGAAGAGLVQRSHVRAQVADQKAKQFNMSLLRDHIIQHNQEMKSRLPTLDTARKDTLGFVYRGDGIDNPNASPADAAKAAEAAGKAEAAKATEDTAKTAAPPAPDQNAMMAAMMAQAQGAQGAAGAQGGMGSGRFGRMSSGFGALKGGAGMAGGVGRGFDNLNMKNQLLAKGSGIRGGVEAGVGSNPLGKGAARNWVAAGPKTSGVRNATDANRLRSMSALMAANRPGDVTKAAAANNAAWDAAAPTGQSIQGAGASAPGISGGPSSSVPDVGGPGEGGPTSIGGGDANADIAPNVPDVPEFKNVTPYQWAVDLAKIILAAALVVAVVAFCSKWIPLYGAAIYGACVAILMVLGGLLAAFGAYMVSMGQTLQGLVWTGMGVTMLIAAATNPAAGTLAWAWAALAGAPILGFLASDSAHDSDNSDAEKKARDDYEKKWGVDSKTGQVPDKNKAQFDERYGKGAADQYNKSHKPYST